MDLPLLCFEPAQISNAVLLEIMGHINYLSLNYCTTNWIYQPQYYLDRSFFCKQTKQIDDHTSIPQIEAAQHKNHRFFR